MVGTSLAFYKGQEGLSLENPQKKTEKGLPGQSKTLEKESKNDNFSSFFQVFGSFSTLFRAFSAPGPRPLEALYRIFCGVFFLTPVERQRCPNPMDLSQSIQSDTAHTQLPLACGILVLCRFALLTEII